MERSTNLHFERLERLKEDLRRSEILESNKKLILDFTNNCLAEGISAGRAIKYIFTLKKLSELFGKPFNEVSRQDVVNVTLRLEQSNYSEWTKKDYKVALKKFFKWLRQSEYYPEEVRWLKASVKNEKKLLPEEILTEEDVKKIASAALNPRDRALVLTLYESGARIGK